VANGKLYAITCYTNVDSLYSVNLADGSLTLVGTSGIDYDDLGSTTQGVYAVGDDANLYSVDPATGGATLIGPTGLILTGARQLSTNASSLYFAVGPNLYTLDTATGAATLVGNMGGPVMEGMVWEGGVLYAGEVFPGSRVDILDPITGLATRGPLITGIGSGFCIGLAPNPLPDFPVVTLSPTSLNFGVQLVDTRSAAQNATLTNSGTATLTISDIAACGDFVQRNDCGSSVPAGESCTIKVAFIPSAKGVRTGMVMITDDAAASPQTIVLTGTGTVVQVSPSPLDFGHQVVGTTSDPLTATVTNIGSEDLHIFGIGIGGANFGDFAETTTCGSRLAAGESCTIDVTFTPRARGHRHASLKIVDDGGASPQAVPLAGTGVPR
jgi:hypothetical protein